MSVSEGASLSMQVKQVLTQHLFNSGDPYELMNAARAWFNQNVPGFEWYLEDEWNHKVEGQTWIEHHIRCLGTRNEFGPIGYDVYLNHQDGKGVWHLDEYQHSVLILNDLSDLMGYLAANQP